MATRYWMDASNDFGAAINWSDGVVPGSWGGSDIVGILRGTQKITAGLAQSGVNIATLTIGPEFKGTVGLPASPLYMGTVADVQIESLKCTQLCLRATVTRGKIYGTNASPYGCYLYGGTWTDVWAFRSPALLLGAALTITRYTQAHTNNMQLDVNAIAEAGCTLTTIRALAGMLKSEAAFTNLYAHNAQIELNDQNLTHALVEQYGGYVLANSPGGIYTAYKGYGGVLDASQDPRSKTFTASESHRGHEFYGDNKMGNITYTAPVQGYGGKVYVSGANYTAVAFPSGGLEP